MSDIKIALIGAGSESFGPKTVRDVLVSETLARRGVHVALMDIDREQVAKTERYARRIAERAGSSATIEATTDLDAALDGADFVVAAIEVKRYLYWAQDFHVPRRYGSTQVYGENGGPGGMFHALRNIPPTIEIARTMERRCPKALLLNFTNPEHKLVEAVSRLSGITAIGLCHGVFQGLGQVAFILGMPREDVIGDACGINHFTWFQTLKNRHTGEDLYPKLREVEREGDWLSDWHEIGMARILFRRYGMWPSPAANHYGEYIGWATEFVASELQYFYDPADGHPWQTGVVPEFVYSLSGDKTGRPWKPQPPEAEPRAERIEDLKASDELAVPIMEAVACGATRDLPAINWPNRGAVPNLPNDLVVEVPAVGDGGKLRAKQMEPLPEAIAAMLRLQGSINRLVVEAFAEQSKAKLLQAVLLDPTMPSYRRAVEMVDEMCALQKDILPPLR